MNTYKTFYRLDEKDNLVSYETLTATSILLKYFKYTKDYITIRHHGEHITKEFSPTEVYSYIREEDNEVFTITSKTIVNPCRAIQLMLVENDPYSVLDIEQPCIYALAHAIDLDEQLINQVKNEHKVNLVGYDINLYHIIDNPSERVQKIYKLMQRA